MAERRGRPPLSGPSRRRPRAGAGSAALALAAAILLAGCAGAPDAAAPGAAPRVHARPHAEGARSAIPRPPPPKPERARREETGIASWYGKFHHGRRTASGQRFDMNAMTAAHRTLPFGTRVEVTNLASGRSAVLVINDRGPFVKGRVIDVSRRAAADLGFLRKGLARVRLRILQVPDA